MTPATLWTSWEFDPPVVVALALPALLYARGARAFRGDARLSRACFWMGWGILALALVSPLHPLGAELFSAHMVQHELLMVLAAPLLVISRPLVPMMRGLPLEWRRTTGRWSKAPLVEQAWRRLTDPLSAWCVHAAALWIWHAPRLFQAALVNGWVHSAQHLSFFVSALLFWWSLFYARGRLGFGAALLYVFTTALHTSILGALLTLAPRVWYPAYGPAASVWGFTPLQDQQVGGLIMWIPAGLVYLAAGLYLLAQWLRESETIAARRWYAQ